MWVLVQCGRDAGATLQLVLTLCSTIAGAVSERCRRRCRCKRWCGASAHAVLAQGASAGA
eukprot:11811926-Alexandrium_andersonii.AAC.1